MKTEKTTMTIEECRKYLEDGGDMTDEQVEEIRNALYEFADLALESYFEKIKQTN